MIWFAKSMFPILNKKFISLLYRDNEKIWQTINEDDDWSLFDNKLKSINNIIGT